MTIAVDLECKAIKQTNKQVLMNWKYHKLRLQTIPWHPFEENKYTHTLRQENNNPDTRMQVFLDGPRRDKTCLRGSEKTRLKPVSSAIEIS